MCLTYSCIKNEVKCFLGVHVLKMKKCFLGVHVLKMKECFLCVHAIEESVFVFKVS